MELKLSTLVLRTRNSRCSGLDMTPFSMGSKRPRRHIYDLYGVVNHHGSLMGGHYTAYARCLNRYNSTHTETSESCFTFSYVFQVFRMLILQLFDIYNVAAILKLS